MSRSPTIAYMHLFPVLETYQISTGTMISREKFTTLCELFIALSDKVAPLDTDLADTTLEALDNFMERNTPDFLYDIVLLNIEFDHLDLFFQIAEPNPVQLSQLFPPENTNTSTQMDVSSLDTSDLTQSDLQNLDFSNIESETLEPENFDFSDLDPETLEPVSSTGYNILDIPLVQVSPTFEIPPTHEILLDSEGLEHETDLASPGNPSSFIALS